MENEMLAFPFVVGVIIGTALLSAFVTTTLPSWPKYWSAFISRIKRLLTRKVSTPKQAIDATTYFELKNRIDILDHNVNNVAEQLVTRNKHLKGNVRRYVREFLQEMADGKHDE